MRQGYRSVFRLLPAAIGATAIVILGPPLLLALVAPGRSLVISVAFCGALALLAARAGDALWRRFPASRDLLFADLMLWGWLRRVRTERHLKQAQSLLSQAGPADKPAALERVVAMMESRDAYTHQHSLRVSRYSEGIARQLGLGEAAVERIRAAAALHDVGKLFTPREILNKPGRLTDGEFAVIQRHPGAGADLVRGLVGPDIEAMIRFHHERLGGTGYPSGLAGTAIPLGARIIAVADTFDAMTSTRAYRRARAHQKALTVLKEEAGTALDAGVVTAFLAFYSGRRGVLTSGAASGFSPAVGAMRELFGGGVARLAPLLSTSAMVAAPMVTATLPSLAMAHDATTHHRAPAARQAAAVPERPALTRVSFTPATAAPPLADRITVAEDVAAPAPVRRPVRHPRPRPEPSHTAPVASPPVPTPAAAPALPVLADEMPTATPAPVVTGTPAADPTPTVVVKVTPTPVPTATPTITPAALTPTPTATPTATPVHTAASTPVPTATPTDDPTPVPTLSAVPTPVVTPVPTKVPTVQPTPTVVPTIVITLPPLPIPLPIPTVTIPLPFPLP